MQLEFIPPLAVRSGLDGNIEPPCGAMSTRWRFMI